MYEKDSLRDYIANSELRVFSNNIRVRLSKELAIKYDNNVYNNYLNHIQEYFDMLNNLGITYPGNAHPIFYIYVVPDDNYSKLLGIPEKYDKGIGGGKPVRCYDIDGFNDAYGTSQNSLENYPEHQNNIAKIENEIHELAHIIHGQFYNRNLFLSEGFAETLPLYVLDYENLYEEHKNAILNLKEDEIFTAQELINSQKDGSFGNTAVLPNKRCSFRHSYISSYLFVRGCFEIIKDKYNLSKTETTQFFLEMIKSSRCYNEYLVFDIANTLGIPQEELLNGKTLQMNVIKSIENNVIIKK